MAKFIAFLLLALIAISILATTSMANAIPARRSKYGDGSLRPEQCAPECKRRCKLTTKKACKFFCNKCCLKCLCVPPGYYGNKQVCRCYNNWKTKEGGPKCP